LLVLGIAPWISGEPASGGAGTAVSSFLDSVKRKLEKPGAEDAFRAMKSHLLLRPMWHQNPERITAHVFVCVLAYALWKALAHLLANAKLMTQIRKKDPDDPDGGPQDRPMSPTVALKLLHDVQIGDILLETVEGRKLRLRRVARPNAEQAEIIQALGLRLPERLGADRDATPAERDATPKDRDATPRDCDAKPRDRDATPRGCDAKPAELAPDPLSPH
jgi:hypothetical protein